MKKIKIFIYLLFTLNFVGLLLLMYVEFSFSDQFNKFNLLAASEPTRLTKIQVLDSDTDLYSTSSKSQSDENSSNSVKTHSPIFLMPEQRVFWTRWQYSLLSSMKDEVFYSALSQVKNVGFYNSGYFNNDWLSDIYQPFHLNKNGLLDLEVLIISWALSEEHFKVTLQYDFYHTKTNRRYLEHVVNITFPR